MALLAELVTRFGGELSGDNQQIQGVASLAQAGKGDVCFVSNARYASVLAQCHATAVVLTPDLVSNWSGSAIITTNPYLYFVQVSQYFNPLPVAVPGVHPSACIAPEAQVDATAQIGPFVYIAAGANVGPRVILRSHVSLEADSVIEEDSLLHNGVKIAQGCHVGARNIIHAGAVIGSDGFGGVKHTGRWFKMPQVGCVRLGADVEVGANTTLDRGALDDTLIGDGVKIDNQVQVGHNVVIGEHTAIAGCVGIAGSARIGAHCWVGGGAVVLGHLEIADHVSISAGTVVASSIAEPGTYTGIYPVLPHRAWQHSAVQIKKLGKHH